MGGLARRESTRGRHFSSLRPTPPDLDLLVLDDGQVQLLHQGDEPRVGADGVRVEPQSDSAK